MAILNRDAALSVQDVSTKDVPVPEWGCDVRIRALTHAERREFSRLKASGEAEYAAEWLIMRAVIDEKGAAVYKWPDDREFLGQRNGGIIQKLGMAVMELNEVGEKRVLEEEKN
jgi:hypothetical protein